MTGTEQRHVDSHSSSSCGRASSSSDHSSVTGDGVDDGMIPRSISYLFAQLQRGAAEVAHATATPYGPGKSGAWALRCSYLEVGDCAASLCLLARSLTLSLARTAPSFPLWTGPAESPFMRLHEIALTLVGFCMLHFFA